MALISSHKNYPFVLFLLLFVSSKLFNGIHGFENQQTIPTTKFAVINHESCMSCPGEFSSLKDVDTYSQLKYDPQASLPSSFTICVSVLVTTYNRDPSLFTVLGNDGRPWISARIQQFPNFVGKQFVYPSANKVAKIDTMRLFPNRWVRSCLALNQRSARVIFSFSRRE